MSHRKTAPVSARKREFASAISQATGGTTLWGWLAEFGAQVAGNYVFRLRTAGATILILLTALDVGISTADPFGNQNTTSNTSRGMSVSSHPPRASFVVVEDSAIVMDNGGCGIVAHGRVSLVIRGRTHIQRNRGGGICVSNR